MTLEKRVEALATTVAQQQATIVQMQAEIAGMKEAGGPGKVVIAAQNQAAKTHEEIFNEKLDLIISLMPPLKL